MAWIFVYESKLGYYTTNNTACFDFGFDVVIFRYVPPVPRYSSVFVTVSTWQVLTLIRIGNGNE